MERFKRILVGLTRTDTDTGLLQYASRIARLGMATEVHFLHVLPQNSAAAGSADGGPMHDAVIAEMQRTVAENFADVPATTQTACHVSAGPLLDEVLSFVGEKQVDLILIGHQKSHNVQRSLARRLAMNAPCSVWMVPEGSPARIVDILVPVDFSGHSADALHVAASLAHALGLERCLALHVYFNDATTTFQEYEGILHERDTDAFNGFLAPLETHGVKVVPLVEEGAIVSHVVSRVTRRENANLVVINTRGRSQSAAILLGSAAEQILLESEVPVLVVKHYGAHLSALQALREKLGQRGNMAYSG